ncbi:MAG: hypothetical protein AB1635_00300 [Acidobacteriota bacterium]
MTAVRLTALVLAAVFVVACRSNAPLVVSNIQLGRSLNTDNTIGDPRTVFRPTDTIYVSVQTTATGSGTLGVRWEYEGRTVSEPSKPVSYQGAAATEFHIQNSGGFPPGNYAVEVFLDGVSVGRRTFTVER